jgi:hypothetical protein
MPDNIKRIGQWFYLPLVLHRNTFYSKIGEYPTLRMMATKSLGLLDQTFQILDSFYPNIFLKKAAHWVIT